jgi:hypothetical protein
LHLLLALTILFRCIANQVDHAESTVRQLEDLCQNPKQDLGESSSLHWEEENVILKKRL